jgi:hypothetical protein
MTSLKMIFHFVIRSAYEISLPDFKQMPFVAKPFTKDQLQRSLGKAFGPESAASNSLQ